MHMKLARIKAGLTQSQVAKELNVTNQTVSRWETNQVNPDVETIKKLAKIYNVTTDYLLEMDED